MIIDMKTAAFIVVDMQNDFCRGGALAVPNADTIVSLVNKLASFFDICVATQDWHPEGHVSFASSHAGARAFDPAVVNGRDATLWPDHCVRGTRGAELHSGIDTRPYRLIVRKGYRQALDSYSAFFENDGATPTGLDGYLKGLGVTKLYIAGLALDYCVYYSALDAASLGYSVTIVRDACKAVGSPPGSAERALADLASKGVAIIESSEALT